MFDEVNLFVIANEVKQSVENLYNRNNKKDFRSSQAACNSLLIKI